MANDNSSGSGEMMLVAVFQETDGARDAVKELRRAGFTADLGDVGSDGQITSAMGDTFVRVVAAGRAKEAQKMLMDNGATSVTAEVVLGGDGSAH